jgi:hypothetical protein
MQSVQPGTTSSEVYVRSENVVSRVIAGEVLVVPVRRGVGDLASIYSFNETGTTLWEGLRSGASLSELVKRIEQSYEVSHEQAEKDVNLFLSQMHDAGLLHVLAGPSAVPEGGH